LIDNRAVAEVQGETDQAENVLGTPLWIFGYGSLMWRPGFEFEEALPARVEGWRRGFYIYSTHHRGTHARPGLVLGLDRGGACAGVAFRVAPERAATTLGYLRAREQINGVYREKTLSARLGDGSGRRVPVIAFVAERTHPSYAGQLPLATQIRLIRGASGISGPNLHYLINTVRQLDMLGVREHELSRLLVLAGPHICRKDTAHDLHRRTQALVHHCLAARVKVPLMRKGERRRFVHRIQMAEWARPSKICSGSDIGVPLQLGSEHLSEPRGKLVT
jgi:cation transport protein ChaC